MKLPKTLRIIAVTLLAFLPIAVFVAISQYDNPLGCGLDTLPKFIKAILTIIVKVGIPIATLFIIWSGFLFLTAQGDEAQLTKAKKAFLWACIGTAVLLGAWLLATAINATIQSLGGGTSSGAGTTVNGGCGGTPPPATLATIPPIPPHEIQIESASAACIGGGGMTGAVVMEKAFREYWERHSWFSKTPLGTSGVDLGPVKSGAEDCLYEKGVFMTKIQANQVAKEQGWFYVIGTNGNNHWESVGNGTTERIVIPLQNFQQFLSSGAQGIVQFHTHPQEGLKNTKRQTIPSSGDILGAAQMNSIFGVSVQFRVSDSAVDLSRPDAPYTIWTYNATNASPFVSLTKTGIGDGWGTFTGSIEALASSDPNAMRWVEDFNKQDTSTTGPWINDAWSMLNAAGNGTYGTTIQNMAKDYGQKIANTPLYAWWNTYRNCTTGEDITNQMLEIYRSNGVTITEEQHPYMACI